MTPGIAQANDESSGMNDLPREPDPDHQPVHQVGRAGHVAAVFQDWR